MQFNNMFSTEHASGDFLSKLQAKVTIDLGALGSRESQLTYYIWTAQRIEVSTIELNPSEWSTYTRCFTAKDGKEITIKFLDKPL